MLGACRDELLADGERAAGMPSQILLGQHVDEADAVVDRALVERIGAEEAVDVVGAQVGHHLRRRHRADLDVLVGVEAVLRHVVAQQVVVHRVVEGHGELEALPRLGSRLSLCLMASVIAWPLMFSTAGMV